MFIDRANKETILDKVNEHGDLTTGVHGVGSNYVATAPSSGDRAHKVVWLPSGDSFTLTVSNVTSSISSTEWDVSAYVPSTAKFLILRQGIYTVTVGSGDFVLFYVKENGTTDPSVRWNLEKVGCYAGVYHYSPVSIVALDGDLKIAYLYQSATGWEVNLYITVVGYIE